MAEKCYARPQRESLPQWPCEDASTALKLCCLSAVVYDVRCYWNTTTYQGDLVDHSPGEIVGTDAAGTQLINCPETGANTNLQGKAFFWFPDANATDQINPWRPCPQVCSESQLPGGIITNCLTGVQVTWSYSCDTGLVTFNSTWIFAPGGQPASFLTFPSVGIVTANPDWYLSNEVDIPYLTTGVNNDRPRFSVKLKMTCEAKDPCEIENACWQGLCPCLIDGSTGQPYRTIYADVSGPVTENELPLAPNSNGDGFEYTQASPGNDYVVIQCVNGGLSSYYVAARFMGITRFFSIPAGGLQCNGNQLVDETVTDGTMQITFYTL